jgi:S-adenosylmethionine:tRNA ribosyltransferase-isomerase
MHINTFDFDLPQELIAQSAIKTRDESNLMVVSSSTESITHTQFKSIGDFLDSNCVLVLNNSKVFNARLIGEKYTSAQIEIFLTEQLTETSWKCLIKPLKRVSAGDIILFSNKLRGKIITKDTFSTISFEFSGNFFDIIDEIGLPPLPPYIKADDPKAFQESYQTTYAKHPGSIAAPTAGLHFTTPLINSLKAASIPIEMITLHVGYGTFQPIRVEKITDHEIHKERYYIDPQTASRLTKYKKEGKKIVSVGTTTTRTLETAFQPDNTLLSGSHSSDLFIYPGYKFKFVDAMITNFHLPKSSLFMLVCAFGGIDLLQQAYAQAIKNKYRFYSLGDAMLLI